LSARAADGGGSLDKKDIGVTWHEVRLRKLPPDFEDCWDAFLKRRIGTLHRAELWKAYGMAAYALSARALTKQEAKALRRGERA